LARAPECAIRVKVPISAGDLGERGMLIEEIWRGVGGTSLISGMGGWRPNRLATRLTENSLLRAGQSR
jgi:hypothetical protein